VERDANQRDLPSATQTESITADGAEDVSGVLWGYRDGDFLYLVAHRDDIPPVAAVRLSFSRAGDLVFAAHYVGTVVLLSGDRIEGKAFTGQDGSAAFAQLRATKQARDTAKDTAGDRATTEKKKDLQRPPEKGSGP
jgi:hypothetical protein